MSSHAEIYEPTSLLDWVANRAQSGDGRKVVFVVGAPLTEPERGSDVGVANVGSMIGLVLREIEASYPEEAAKLRRLREHELLDGELYQQAMSKLGELFDEAAVNKVVRSGVLKAIAPGAHDQMSVQSRVSDVGFLLDLEQQLQSWSLRAGVEALGQLLTAGLPGLAPIVLTSNFDPLIEVSIRKWGANPQTLRYDRDGGLDHLDLDTGPVKVVHFHGWWREGNTLHTAPMLTSNRPALASAMATLLTRYCFVPVAYGGWSDVLTSTLRGECSGDRIVDVRWGLYPTNRAKARGECAHLIEQYPPNKVRFYRGVDCHKFFPTLVDRLVTASPRRTSGAIGVAPSPQPQWTRNLSSAIDWDSVRMLRRAVEEHNPGSSGTGDDWSFLENRLGILVRDQQQRLVATQEAILLVGTTDAVRRQVNRPIVDLQFRQDTSRIDPAIRWSGREVIEDNLVKARLQLLEKFAVYKGDEPGDGRVDSAASGVMTSKPGYIAFREAAINLLVHQSYELGTAKGLIELSKHGWHFENSGCPTGSEADLVSPSPMAYRNPLINRAFRDAGWTENGKTGLRAMSAAWMRLGRAPPKVSLLRENDRFRVEFSFDPRTTLQAAAWIAQLGMSPTEVQQDFLSLLAARNIHDKSEFQLAMALPSQEFAAVLQWGLVQRVVEESDLQRGVVAPTPSFAARISGASNHPTVATSPAAEGELGGLDDTSLRILGLFAEGVRTMPRLLDALKKSRPTITSRLQRLEERGLLRVDRSSNTHIWTLTEAGETTALAIAR